KPLLHTWSLAVEEQYYIAFPLLLYVLRRRTQRTQVAVLGTLFALSLAACVWFTRRDGATTFYLAPFRTWELLTGSLLAVGTVPAIARPIARELVAGSGLALIAWSVLSFTEATPFPGSHALAPCIGAALIIHAGRDGTSFIGRLLASPPFVFVGKIS